MLIDDYLPEFDAVERHSLVIRAAPARVWAALRAADFGRSPLIATLLGLRALPSLLTAPRRTLRRLRERDAERLTLDTFFSRGFVVLEERPDREMVIGLEGRFWTAAGDLRPTDARRFREALAPGLARAAWDFRAEPLPGGRVRLALRAARQRPHPARQAARDPARGGVARTHIGSRERVRRWSEGHAKL